MKVDDQKLGPSDKKEWAALLLLITGATATIASYVCIFGFGMNPESGTVEYVFGASWFMLLVFCPIIYRWKRMYGKIALALVVGAILIGLLFPRT